MKNKTSNSIHSFSIEAIDGSVIDFSSFSGRKIMLVNVASECGLTPQYQQLQDLYAQYKNKLSIVACPANDFGQQEPGTNQQIQTFCSTKFNVSFPMTHKISVKGNNMHNLYKFVTQKELNGFADSEVSWNFQKYVFDEAGQLCHIFAPQTEPLADEILSALAIHP
jgi:glutathione peroxidase